MPLLLVLLMLFRPRGIMGLREFRWFVPPGATCRRTDAGAGGKEAADAAP